MTTDQPALVNWGGVGCAAVSRDRKPLSILFFSAPSLPYTEAQLSRAQPEDRDETEPHSALG